MWEGCEWEANVTGMVIMSHYVNAVIWRICSYKKYKIGGIHLETTVKEVATVKESRYRRAKTWQIGAFALNNSATNIFMFLMMYVSYYATGVVGLGTVIVSTLITMSRIWDGITDPIIGLWIDKTDGKMGKFRPFMIMGWG